VPDTTVAIVPLLTVFFGFGRALRRDVTRAGATAVYSPVKTERIDWRREWESFRQLHETPIGTGFFGGTCTKPTI
jgi:hypothetical protein